MIAIYKIIYKGGKMIAIYKLLSKRQSKKIAKQIEQWFKDNPRRRVCHTDIHGGTTIHRGHITEDLAEHTVK